MVSLIGTATVLVLAMIGGLVAILIRHDPTAIPELPETVDAIALTGDPRAANPCALLDPVVMSRFGISSVGPGNAIGECRITSDPSAAIAYYTEAHFGDTRTESSTAPTVQDLGGLRIARKGITRQGGCSTSLLLQDRTNIVVTTRTPTAGTQPPTLCEVNEAAVAVAVTRLADNGITYSPDWQAGIALANDSACELPADAPARIPRLIADQRRGWPNGAVCYIGSNAQPGVPYVTITLGLEPAGNLSSYGTPSVVNGKSAYTRPVPAYISGNGQACAVSVVHRPSYDGGATHPSEYVTAQIEGSGTYQDNCSQATGLAVATEQNASD